MLATSSSEDEDYDDKKPSPSPQASKSQYPPQHASFLTSHQQLQRPGGGMITNQGSNPYQQSPNMNRNNANNFNNNNMYNNMNMNTNNANYNQLQNVNAMANVNLNNNNQMNNYNNGFDDTRSSFSTSSDSVSLNRDSQGQFMQNNRANNMQNNSFQRSHANQSFKSNSSSSAIGGGGFNSTMTPNSTHTSLNTPRVDPQKQNARGHRSGRQSFSTNGDDQDESDDNDYNYESQYSNINPLGNQNNDSQDEQNGKKKRGSKVPEEDKESTAAAAALIAQQNEALKELEIHKKRLQIYCFLCRCISYPFIAKQPTDMVRRQTKITKQQLNLLKESFDLFLTQKMTPNIEADEAFTNAVRSYYEVFLKSERVSKMVLAGACSTSDFRDVFKNNIEKRVRSLPEIDGLSKETVLNSWMVKFDLIYRYNEDSVNYSHSISSRRHSRTHLNPNSSSECVLTKEQLYDMFQNILGIKKFEHQLIFNAAQLDNADEQAATIRRELDSRMKQTENVQKNGIMPKFVHKNMESTYIEELKQSISLLMNHLDNQPVGTSESKLRLPKRINKSDQRRDDPETGISKNDVVLNFDIELVVMEVKGLKSLPPNRIVFCVMEVEGQSKLQTDQAEASRPIWDTSGDFKTHQPLPILKVKLYMETQNILQDMKEVGRVVLRPDPMFTRAATWYVMDKADKKFPDELKIKLTVRIDKPGNLKMCGWCYCMGKTLWKKYKKRYLCLVQVSQYTFVLCSYVEKKSEPREFMTLDNYTVDYADTDPELKALGGKCFFNAVKEGDNVSFATEEDSERQLWIQALYRATGQSHKPTPPTNLLLNATKQPTQLTKAQGDADKARKHGMEEYIQADPSTFNHNELFKELQTLTLEYRLSDQFCCLGWFNPGQIFVLDEYQARYGVRGCYRHLCYLSDLLDRAEQNFVVDPTLLHYSFAFCACHVHGNRPDGIGTVTNEEKVKFDEIKERLRNLLEYQITHFRYCFPFGRPEGALKQTLSLLERVLMKDIVTPVTPEEVKAVIRKCLENAALVNYTRISQNAKVEDNLYNPDIAPKKKIEDLIHLAELCIDLLQQNEEHHSESFAWFCELLVEHEEIFWSLFAVDMDHVIEQQALDSWDSFPLFQLLNDYLRNHPSLSEGKFHKHLQDIFAPLIIRYVDLMESSIGQSIHKGFEKETWKNRGQGCLTSEDMLWKLDALQSFIKDLNWPDEVFGEHLEHRLKQMASDMIEACTSRVMKHFDSWMKKGIIILNTNSGTDYVFPAECGVMVNVIIDCKAQALKLCSLNSGDLNRYHTKIDEYLEKGLVDMKKQLISKLVSVLDGLLKKLSRYDEGSFFSSILSLTKPVNELGNAYVTFVALNLDVLRQKINDELFVNSTFENWYTEQVKLISSWLSERMEICLHPYQLACLTIIVKKVRSDFELQGVDAECVLDTATYNSILSRINVEEANQALK